MSAIVNHFMLRFSLKVCRLAYECNYIYKVYPNRHSEGVYPRFCPKCDKKMDEGRNGYKSEKPRKDYITFKQKPPIPLLPKKILNILRYRLVYQEP